MNNRNVLIILDSFEYKEYEQKFRENLSEFCFPDFFYTKYENILTNIFNRTKYLGSALQHLTYWLMSLSYAIKLLFYRKDSNYVFINPIVGIFFAMLCRIFFLKRKISIGGFLFEKKSNAFYLTLRKIFVNFSYRDVDKIFVYGENEVNLYSTIFPKLAKKFTFVQYGKDYNYKNKKDFSYENAYISSGGRSNRNFEVLCSAIDLMKNREFDCLIATRPECVLKDMEHSNVKWIFGITLNQFGSFIANSKVFVLPLMDTKISAGHMALMEAMSVNIPIIVSDIPAIRNYVDESCVTFFEPNSAEDLKKQIMYVWENLSTETIKQKIANARKMYEKNYSFSALLKRIVSCSLA